MCGWPKSLQLCINESYKTTKKKMLYLMMIMCPITHECSRLRWRWQPAKWSVPTFVLYIIQFYFFLLLFISYHFTSLSAQAYTALDATRDKCQLLSGHQRIVYIFWSVRLQAVHNHPPPHITITTDMTKRKKTNTQNCRYSISNDGLVDCLVTFLVIFMWLFFLSKINNDNEINDT